MNEYTQYDLIMAEKLQTLPVPDLADAIWVRIERQLDIDMPATGDGDDLPAPPAGSGWMGGIILSVVAGAFVLAFLWMKKEDSKAVPQPLPVPAGQEEMLPVLQPADPAKRATEKNAVFRPPGIPLVSTPDSTTSPGQPAEEQVALPVNRQPGPYPVVADSLPPAQGIQDTVVTRPKPRRGVTGINRDDYRIVPKKDSL